MEANATSFGVGARARGRALAHGVRSRTSAVGSAPWVPSPDLAPERAVDRHFGVGVGLTIPLARRRVGPAVGPGADPRRARARAAPSSARWSVGELRRRLSPGLPRQHPVRRRGAPRGPLWPSYGHATRGSGPRRRDRQRATRSPRIRRRSRPLLPRPGGRAQARPNVTGGPHRRRSHRSSRRCALVAPRAFPSVLPRQAAGTPDPRASRRWRGRLRAAAVGRKPSRSMRWSPPLCIDPGALPWRWVQGVLA